jgi:hypothetical protein
LDDIVKKVKHYLGWSSLLNTFPTIC